MLTKLCDTIAHNTISTKSVQNMRMSSERQITSVQEPQPQRMKQPAKRSQLQYSEQTSTPAAAGNLLQETYVSTILFSGGRKVLVKMPDLSTLFSTH